MTECITADNGNEEILKQLLVLEKELEEHYNLMKSEIILQNDAVAKILIISQKYNILERSLERQYSVANTISAEDALLMEFLEKIAHIRNSNSHINSSLHGLRKTYEDFENLCALVDMKTGSSLIIGGVFQKPLSYFIELVSDFIKFFQSWILKLLCCTYHLEPGNIQTIEDYKKHTEISTDFEEHFYLGLSYLKCLRSKTK